jgi:predicted transcriptional regulator
MGLIMPQELEVWYLLPAIRRELARELLKLGMNQSEAAERLGMTRASISQYLNSKRGKKLTFDSATLREIKKCAHTIYNHKSCIVQNMHNLSRIAKQNKVLCKVHKACDSSSHRCCKVCLR